MTPETLKLYEKLQKLFGEKMGEVIPLYDRLSYNGTEFIPIKVTKFDVLRVDSILGDIWIPVSECCRLPLPIDPVNPERGLWGMVDWERFNDLLAIDGTLNVRSIIYGDCCREEKVLWESGFCTPTEALLRALIAQEGL